MRSCLPHEVMFNRSCAQRAARSASSSAGKCSTRGQYLQFRCPQPPHVGGHVPGGILLDSIRAAAAVEAQLAEPASPAPSATAQQQDTIPQQRSKASRQGGSGSQQQNKGVDGTGRNDAAIVVAGKPVTNAIIRRLEAVPEAVLRASQADDASTYKALTALAAAQRKLADAGKVVVYVPYTKASRFTAQLVTADASITASITGAPLTVKASTDAAALGNTLAFELVKHGGASLSSAGPTASAKVAEALRVARGQLLRKGYEIGVVPGFVMGTGATGNEITILQQKVVIEELPPPEVEAPSSSKKPLDAAASAAATLLQRQRRCILKVRQGQLSRLTELLHKVADTPTGLIRPGAAAEAGGGVEGGAAAAAAADGDKAQEKAGKQRLLLVSYAGTTTPSKPSTATPAAEPAAATGSEAAGAEPAAGSEVPLNASVSLQLLRSRFTVIPEPRVGLVGPEGPLYAKKPIVATGDSAVAGLVGAIEAKLSRVGAAWLYTDGTEAGNKAAWETYAAAARKLSGRADKGALLALVKIDQGSAAADRGQGLAQSMSEEPPEVQQQQSQEASSQQQANGSQLPAGFHLSMLLVEDDDIPRSILQAPNAPLESSKVALRPALQLIKFTAAANSFLPVSDTTGTGGLVILPAVLPAAKTTSCEEPAAVDYRFSINRARQTGYDYFFRLQRFTQELSGGLEGPEVAPLRVSVRTDPSKLRDAIVAKALQSEPAALRFIAPPGKLPTFMLSIAMTAVAAARVRLQSKQAGVDVGVMPLVLPVPVQADSAEGKAKADDTQQVVYSLRLVPLPAVSAATALDV